MMALTKPAVMERIELARSRLSIVKVKSVEIAEMTMLLRANLDDVEMILNEGSGEQLSLFDLDDLISEIIIGIESLQD